MNWHFVLMIAGDLITIIVMGFYAGVGIWESGTVQHILGMLLPPLAVWVFCALIFRLYRGLPESIGPAKTKELSGLLERLIAAQKPQTLIFVWGITCMAQCFWQSWYWRGIIRSQTYFYRFNIHIVIWYAVSYALFFIFWRALWTACVTIIAWGQTCRSVRIVCSVIGAVVFLYILAIAAIELHYRSRKFTVETIPEGSPRTALVFGAGVYYNGEPSAVLTDRVRTAVELYQQGSIDEMIMSGDNSDASRNEVDHMIQMAVEAGVPEEAILRDDRGIHTAESLYNTKNILGKDNVIYVSQDFHNTRILMTGERYDLSGVAVRADRRIYNIWSWMLWYVLDWMRLPIYWLHY